MQAKRYLFWGGALALLGGALAALRPALVLAAKVTAVTPGNPSTASVVLSYGSGTTPTSVIVDVYGQDGSGGSATVKGEQMFLEVPIFGVLGGEYRITTTASYRLLGLLWTSVREFTGSLPPVPAGAV